MLAVSDSLIDFFLLRSQYWLCVLGCLITVVCFSTPLDHLVPGHVAGPLLTIFGGCGVIGTTFCFAPPEEDEDVSWRMFCCEQRV